MRHPITWLMIGLMIAAVGCGSERDDIASHTAVQALAGEAFFSPHRGPPGSRIIVRDPAGRLVPGTVLIFHQAGVEKRQVVLSGGSPWILAQARVPFELPPGIYDLEFRAGAAADVVLQSAYRASNQFEVVGEQP